MSGVPAGRMETRVLSTVTRSGWETGQEIRDGAKAFDVKASYVLVPAGPVPSCALAIHGKDVERPNSKWPPCWLATLSLLTLGAPCLPPNQSLCFPPMTASLHGGSTDPAEVEARGSG